MVKTQQCFPKNDIPAAASTPGPIFNSSQILT